MFMKVSYFKLAWSEFLEAVPELLDMIASDRGVRLSP